MMQYEDIQVQLVDLPPLSDEYMENWLSSIIRIADMMLIVVDVSRDDLLDQLEMTLNILDRFKITSKVHESDESLWQNEMDSGNFDIIEIGGVHFEHLE